MLEQDIPENLLTGCMRVLPFITASERDLIRVVVELIQDLRDPGDDIDAIAREAEVGAHTRANIDQRSCTTNHTEGSRCELRKHAQYAHAVQGYPRKVSRGQG